MTLLSFTDVFKRPLFFPLLFLIGFIVYHDQKPANFIDPTLLGKPYYYQGLIQKVKTKPMGGKKFEIKLTHYHRQQKFEKPVLILLTVVEDLHGFKAGDEVLFKTKLKKALSYQNPGGFDYARYLKRQGVAATGFVAESSSLKLIKRSPPGFWQQVRSRLQQNINQELAQKNTPNSVGSIIRALMWGEASSLDSETKELFRRYGLSHLLIISGLHFACLGLFFFQFFLFLMRFWPALLKNGQAYRLVCLLTAVSLSFYVLLLEPTPSVWRAYIGSLCFLVALALKRKNDLLNILFLAALLILSVRPADLFSVSFQLSFTAVLSLIVIYPPLKTKFGFQSRFEGGRLKKAYLYVAQLFIANLAIFIGISPLILFYFHQVQIASLAMNLWAMPFVEFLIVPLGFLSLVMALIFPPLVPLFLKIEIILIQIFVSWLEFLSQFFSGSFNFFPPHGWELGLIYLFILVCCFKIKQPVKRFLVWGFVFVLVVDLAYYGYQIHFSDRFRITHLDVGQGDALLVELPDAKRVLIDGGGSRFFDIGKNVLLPYLRHQRLGHIDVLCITHADLDHYGGFVSLIDQISVSQVWWNGLSPRSDGFEKFLTTIRNKGIPLRSLSQGMNLKLGDQASFKVLSPSGRDALHKNDNNHSLVLKLTVGDYAALFTGDIGRHVERRLVADASQALKADYLKIAHHGSSTSTSPTFLKQVDPLVATVGSRPRIFGHPHPRVVRRLSRQGVRLYRTDVHGAIVVDFKKAGIKVVPTVNRASPRIEPSNQRADFSSL